MALDSKKVTKTIMDARGGSPQTVFCDYHIGTKQTIRAEAHLRPGESLKEAEKRARERLEKKVAAKI